MSRSVHRSPHGNRIAQLRAKGAAGAPPATKPQKNLPPHQTRRLAADEIPAGGSVRAQQILAQLIGKRVAVPAIKHKNFDLAKAVADPSFQAKDPATLPVPQELMDRIRNADSVLLIGHGGFPDLDDVGANESARELILALNPDCKVDICIDATLSPQLLRFDPDGVIKQPSAFAATDHWDLAMMIDVGVVERIGGAKELLPRADAVAIADHHEVTPTRAEFELPSGKPFIPWIEPDFPAAALGIAALIGHFEPELPKDVDPARLYRGALAGFATDTDWGHRPGLDKETFRYFKHMLARSGLSLGALEAEAKSELPRQIRRRIARLEEREIHGPNGERMVVLSCNSEKLQALVRDAQALDPEMTLQEVTNGLKTRLDSRLKSAGGPADVAALVFESEGAVSVSTRSEGERDALELAVALGAKKGHSRMAGAFCPGAEIGEVRDRLFAAQQARWATSASASSAARP